MKLYRKKYKLIETYGVFFIDLFAIALSYFIARLLRLSLPFGATITEETIWFPVYVLCIIGCVIINLMPNRYEGFFRRGYFIEAGEVLRYNFLQFVFLGLCIYLFRLEMNFSRLMLFYFGICDSFVSYLFRIVFKSFIQKTYKKGKGSEKILLITDSKHFENTYKSIVKDQGWSYEVVGIAMTDALNKAEAIHYQPTNNNDPDEYPDIVAGREDLLETARQMSIDLVIIDCPDNTSELNQWIQSFATMGVKIYYCVQTQRFSVPYSGVGEFADFPIICYNNKDRDWRMSVVKRLADILGSIVGLVITIIFFPFIAIAIKLEDPKGKVFFSQTRIGKNGRRFKLYKFRSMYADAESRKKELLEKNEVQGPMFKIEDDPRITKVGKFLRRTSLDELPQFWNILKGDMSLVGTRPPTEDEFEQYNDYYRRRMSITPGLTGLWQVSGRSDIANFEEVVKLDLQYIDNWNIGQDIKIILQTIGVVFSREGSK